MIVIDASVAVKWYLPECGTDAAIELAANGNQLAAPELIRLEVVSAITRRVRVGETSAGDARAQCDRWLNNLTDGAVSLVPEQDLLHDSIDLSLKLKHPLLDCMYLAAARRLEAHLLTADRVFHDRAKPFYKNISILHSAIRPMRFSSNYLDLSNNFYHLVRRVVRAGQTHLRLKGITRQAVSSSHLSADLHPCPFHLDG